MREAERAGGGALRDRGSNTRSGKWLRKKESFRLQKNTMTKCFRQKISTTTTTGNATATNNDNINNNSNYKGALGYLRAQDDLGPISPLQPGPDDRVSLMGVLRDKWVP